MHQPPPNAGPAVYFIPLFVMGLVILRNSRARRLRIETLWIGPLIILLLVGLSLSQGGMPTPFMMAVDFLALAVGAGLGWWRARFTHISVDPQTHQLTSKASPVGMLIILGIYAAKTAINAFARENAAATAVADALLLVSVGTVCAQRFELFTRASRLLAEARATKAQGEISA